MIPNTTDAAAVYYVMRKAGDWYYRRRQIAAWDDDGTPLVIGGLSLVPPEHFPAYVGIDAGREHLFTTPEEIDL